MIAANGGAIGHQSLVNQENRYRCGIALYDDMPGNLAADQATSGKSDIANAAIQIQPRRPQGCRNVAAADHFAGGQRVGGAVDQGHERLEAETKLATTVASELDKAMSTVAAAITAGYQIDEANTRAKADIVVDGEVIARDVPATFLLQLERRLREVRALFRETPCFDPVRTWTVDVDADRKHVLKAAAVVTIRKARTRKYNVMYEATKEHPAQVDVVEVDEPVGEIRSYEWTGMLASSKKAALVERVDALVASVKQARSRANTIDVNTEERIGKTLCDFLLAPLGV